MFVQDEADQDARNPSMPTQERNDSRRSGGENLDLHSNSPMAFLDPARPTNGLDTTRGENFDTQLDGLFTWPDDCFVDATFDWFAWSNQEFS